MATVMVTAVIVLLALWFPLLTLAKATSFVILVVFTLINLASLRLKLMTVLPRAGLWRPALGAVLSVCLIAMSAL